ncbi:MAG: HI0074 family nucleotidyltransferase substrate-binding subunit [Selenomonadaceae bacterium]|nr:HI0074 family nucleotidyltransferase substrate-binding subunit [Selenomonadaceae bacterium]
MYGLTKKQFETLMKILSSHKEKISKVKLFGSRARGDYRKTSDVDIAVEFLRPIQGILADDFEESDFPYNVDVVDLGTASKDLLENIERDGKLIFLTKEGCVVMTLEQVKAKHEDFEKALKKLQIALKKNIEDDELYLDGLIQRFELCFELAWKVMQIFLSYEGFSVNSPRSAIRKSFESEIISDVEGWINMLESRNLSTHTYDEDTARKIYKTVIEKYIFLLENFNETMKNQF